MKISVDSKKFFEQEPEQVLYWSNGRMIDDMKLREKTLYRAKDGQFFIKHYGGALTDLAQRCAGGMGGRSYIEPVNKKNAFAFLCSHDGTEAAEKWFPGWIKDA